MEGQPWLFNNFLFILMSFDRFTQPLHLLDFDREQFWVQLYNLPLACINRECMEHIGKTLGNLLEVDVLEDEVRWGRLLQIKVELSLSKVIDRGRTINVQGKTNMDSSKL